MKSLFTPNTLKTDLKVQFACPKSWFSSHFNNSFQMLPKLWTLVKIYFAVEKYWYIWQTVSFSCQPKFRAKFQAQSFSNKHLDEIEIVKHQSGFHRSNVLINYLLNINANFIPATWTKMEHNYLKSSLLDNRLSCNKKNIVSPQDEGVIVVLVL